MSVPWQRVRRSKECRCTYPSSSLILVKRFSPFFTTVPGFVCPHSVFLVWTSGKRPIFLRISRKEELENVILRNIAEINAVLFLGSTSIFLFFVGAYAEYRLGIPHIFLRSIFLSVVGGIYLSLGYKVHPYTTFDSLRADRLRSVSNWYKGAILTFLLFSVIFPFISKMLLGY